MKKPKQEYPPVKLGSISMLYDEPKASTYKGVQAYVKLDAKKIKNKIFNTQDPTKDYWTACLWLEFVEKCDTTMLSSSVDHFNHDGGNLNFEPGDAYILAVAKELKKQYPKKAP